MADDAIRVLFVNAGILGHRAVAALLRDLTGHMPGLAASHENLSDNLSIRDRVVRRLLSVRLAPARGAFANLDFRRWRQEWNTGLLAARRIEARERAGERFDVLHFHTQATAYASVARMARTPAIVSLDATQHLASLELESPLARRTYAPNIARDGVVFRAARAIVATSDWAAADLAASSPECEDRLHVMPYPIRGGFCAPWVDERRDRARTVPRPPVRALFIGGDFARKGGYDLLGAWKAGGFADRAVLDLVTDWPIAAGAIPPGVRHLTGVAPYTPAWFDLWRAADLFVMPTRHEAFGMVYQEAGAAGLPSIASAISAVPEIVRDGETGLLIAPGDGAALVAALRRLIDDAALRDGLGRAARARMLTTASPDRYRERLGALIEHVARNDARQPRAD